MRTRRFLVTVPGWDYSRGDVLHTDVGLCYLGLCTDTQEMGYVLKLGESEPPEGLVEAMHTGNGGKTR